MVDSKRTVFHYQAEAGLTKQLGGRQATDALMALCHVKPDSHVLDVGCGVGATACYLAQSYGCQVTGMDILPEMVESARRRADRFAVKSLVTFEVGDACSLPFNDNTFDAVFTESVTVFPTDKQRAVNEYARVVKPGGWVGMNETTWLQPPTPEMVAWIKADYSQQAEPLSQEGYIALLTGAGLQNVTGQTYSVTPWSGLRDLIQRYGLGEFIRILGYLFRLYLTDPEYRAFTKDVRQAGTTPKGMFDAVGYGLYAGQKPGGSRR